MTGLRDRIGRALCEYARFFVMEIETRRVHILIRSARQCGAADMGRRATGVLAARGQLALQETVGQVELPLRWMVTPQLLPLPLGLAVRTWALG
ncbi:hypothetical protein Aple_049570 [Acrocarpospora pleiomorpha]|uniref:Uncharacterized protein n=1 Tax=Acrocarpospora pleiomorpha TaxID=90975 RepID=A0A5M3XM74_9ACTN|nr:hypothetical protein Aple_049570 [Acrocarpospora pleiomorpha]